MRAPAPVLPGAARRRRRLSVQLKRGWNLRPNFALNFEPNFAPNFAPTFERDTCEEFRRGSPRIAPRSRRKPQPRCARKARQQCQCLLLGRIGQALAFPGWRVPDDASNFLDARK